MSTKVETQKTKSETIRKHKEFLFPAVATYYQEPLALVRGEGFYVWDDQGNKYLDCFGGVLTVSVGHLTRKLTRQSSIKSRLSNTRLRSTPTSLNRIWRRSSTKSLPAISRSLFLLTVALRLMTRQFMQRNCTQVDTRLWCSVTATAVVPRRPLTQPAMRRGDLCRLKSRALFTLPRPIVIAAPLSLRIRNADWHALMILKS